MKGVRMRRRGEEVKMDEGRRRGDEVDENAP